MCSRANTKAWKKNSRMELSDRVAESWLRYERHTRASREVVESREANKTRDDVRDAAKGKAERHTVVGFVHTETRIRDLRYVYRTMATSAVKVANNCSPMTYVNDIDHTHATLI